MRKIEQHKFEAVSLLTVDNGLLEVTVIPNKDQPNWLVPSSLILSIDPFYDQIWTYLWNGQEVATYPLIPREESPDKVIVLEGNTDVHRIGLLTKGPLRKLQVKISDVKDIALSKSYAEFKSINNVSVNDSSFHSTVEEKMNDSVNTELPSSKNDANQPMGLPYVYQTVEVDGQVYIVPNLDDLAHRLVDLDS